TRHRPRIPQLRPLRPALPHPLGPTRPKDQRTLETEEPVIRNAPHSCCASTPMQRCGIIRHHSAEAFRAGFPPWLTASGEGVDYRHNSDCVEPPHSERAYAFLLVAARRAHAPGKR